MSPARSRQPSTARLSPPSPAGRGRLTLVALALAAALPIAGCAPSGDAPSPGPSTSASQGQQTPADPALKQLIDGLVSGSMSQVPFTSDGAVAQADYTTIMSGMDGLKPSVTSSGITYNGDKATAQLAQKYSFGAQAWQFTSTVQLNRVDGKWTVQWAPTIVHPELTETTRLRHTRTTAVRGAIRDTKGRALAEQGTLYAVGIDKQNLAPDKWESSAKALAALVKVDPAGYAARVKAAGKQAFVTAITLRQSDLPANLSSVTGAAAVQKPGVVSIDPTFAPGILGVVGEASPEEIKAAQGAIAEGDLVGKSGLQKRYDAQLRGNAGHDITVVRRKDAPTPGPSEGPFIETTLLNQDPVPGKDLTLTLNLEQQQKAEKVLRSVKPDASMVVLKPSTGEIIASASSPAAGANPNSTVGRYAPGSTFKVVSSLALLRKGLSPSSTLPCTATITVDGRSFKNYSDFPSSRVGTLSLQDALATSCNTAFISQHAKVSPTDLAQAASSLGVGTDYDSGFSSYYGSVPNSQGATTRAANLIGQGEVQVSVMAMAGVSASVASGKTTIPWLVKGEQPASKAPALTPTEAAQLKQMMTAVVDSGTASGLKGVMTGAKSGTAEYGTATPPKTHAWMIAFKGDLAIAVMVADGQSGSKSAMPLIKAFLA